MNPPKLSVLVGVLAILLVGTNGAWMKGASDLSKELDAFNDDKSEQSLLTVGLSTTDASSNSNLTIDSCPELFPNEINFGLGAVDGPEKKVTQLQKFLKVYFNSDSQSIVSGTFDTETESALKEFQRANKVGIGTSQITYNRSLQQSGILDADTYTAIYQRCWPKVHPKLRSLTPLNGGVGTIVTARGQDLPRRIPINVFITEDKHTSWLNIFNPFHATRVLIKFDPLTRFVATNFPDPVKDLISTYDPLTRALVRGTGIPLLKDNRTAVIANVFPQEDGSFKFAIPKLTKDRYQIVLDTYWGKTQDNNPRGSAPVLTIGGEVVVAPEDSKSSKTCVAITDQNACVGSTGPICEWYNGACKLPSCGGLSIATGTNDPSKYRFYCGKKPGSRWSLLGATDDCGWSEGSTQNGCFYQFVDDNMNPPSANSTPRPVSTPEKIPGGGSSSDNTPYCWNTYPNHGTKAAANCNSNPRCTYDWSLPDGGHCTGM